MKTNLLIETAGFTFKFWMVPLAIAVLVVLKLVISFIKGKLLGNWQNDGDRTSHPQITYSSSVPSLSGVSDRGKKPSGSTVVYLLMIFFLMVSTYVSMDMLLTEKSVSEKLEKSIDTLRIEMKTEKQLAELRYQNLEKTFNTVKDNLIEVNAKLSQAEKKYDDALTQKLTIERKLDSLSISNTATVQEIEHLKAALEEQKAIVASEQSQRLEANTKLTDLIREYGIKPVKAENIAVTCFSDGYLDPETGGPDRNKKLKVSNKAKNIKELMIDFNLNRAKEENDYFVIKIRNSANKIIHEVEIRTGEFNSSNKIPLPRHLTAGPVFVEIFNHNVLVGSSQPVLLI